MKERGVTRQEAISTVSDGERFPAKFGRTGFRRNYSSPVTWRGKKYATKQVEAYAVEEGEGWLVDHCDCTLLLKNRNEAFVRPRHNIAYLYLLDKTAEVETIRVTDELNVDLTPDGTIYGIELLNANEQLSGLVPGKFVLENEATGETIEVGLP